MHRLTRPISAEARDSYYREGYVIPPGEYTTGNYRWMFANTDEGLAVQKLADYENTGLEPSEIVAMQEAMKKWKAVCDDAVSD